MAVQAQYPSNPLFLNSVQDQKNTNNYSLQPHPGGGGEGGFLDQNNNIMICNNTNTAVGGANSRKRGREITQSQNPPSQFIDLHQLHNNQQNVVSTGLRLAFGHHHQQQHSISSQSSLVLSDDLATQIKQQRDEIDHYLQAQGEQMRRTLAEKRQRHYRALLVTAEESAALRLREKEAEAEKAIRKNVELEASATQLYAESQAWQARARAQEATASNLQAKLQHAIMTRGCARNENEGMGDMDEEGVRLGCAGGVAEDAESGYVDPDRVVAITEPSCKACRTRAASVVLLPCRHLCVCTVCDKVVQTCPLCLCFRNSSVEVFFS